MKTNPLSIILGVILLFATISFVSASNPVTIQSIPETNIWIADNETVHRMDVYTNALLTMEPITGFQWSIMVPNYLNVVNTSLPTSNDFYFGFPMTFNQIDSTAEPLNANFNVLRSNWRLTENPNSGPINRTGYLGSYWFTVKQQAPIPVSGYMNSTFNFESSIGRTFYLDPSATPHSPIIQNTPFKIISLKYLSSHCGSGPTPSFSYNRLTSFCP